MNHVASIVDALYSKFLLRDFFAKIVPGFILLASIYLAIAYSADSSDIVKFLEGLSFFNTLLAIGIFWLTGLAVQAFGEIFSIINYRAPYANSRSTPQQESSRRLRTFLADRLSRARRRQTNENWLQKLVEFKISYERSSASEAGPPKTDIHLQQHERFAVVYEATANAAISLFLSVVILFLFRIIQQQSLTIASYFLLNWHYYFIALVMAAALWVMHHSNMRRQEIYLESVLGNST